MKSRNKTLLLALFFSTCIASFYSFVALKRYYIIHEYFTQDKWKRLNKEFNRMKKVNHSTVFFGDSMTENFKYLPDTSSVVNMGISGDFTEGLIKRIDNVIRFQPDKLFIMIGINDIVEKVPLSEIENNYIKILDLLKTDCPQTKIFIQSTLPTFGLKSLLSSSKIINLKVEKLNTFLLLESKKRNITLINLYPFFVTSNNELNPDLTTDGVHLNKKGYEIWLTQIKPYFN
ncbi:MAG: GDSL-type esterase/lipase family protein [Bacteroidia bacterium]